MIATIGIAITATACGSRGAKVPAIDQQLIGRCVVSYACGMSHPGLGSYSDGRSVDLATCTRTVTSDEGPWQEQMPAPDGEQPGKHTRTSEAVPPERCAEIAKLLATITAADAAAAEEIGQADMASCDLEVTCPKDGPRKLEVRRQTTSGTSVIERLISQL